jgi:hypothetical protein
MDSRVTINLLLDPLAVVSVDPDVHWLDQAGVLSTGVVPIRAIVYR